MPYTKKQQNWVLGWAIATSVIFTAYVVNRAFVALQCPSLTDTDLEKYDADNYLGIWYELRRAKNIPFEDGECVTAQYTKRDDGLIKVDNNQYYGWNGGPDEKRGGIGSAEISTFFPGHLFVSFFLDIGGRYRILDTDYTSYVVVYSCENAVAGAVLFSEYSWVLTRDPIVDGSAEFDAMMAKVDEVYKRVIPDYDHKNLMQTTQHGAQCKYFTK